jgi:hypothetical protein
MKENRMYLTSECLPPLLQRATYFSKDRFTELRRKRNSQSCIISQGAVKISQTEIDSVVHGFFIDAVVSG